MKKKNDLKRGNTVCYTLSKPRIVLTSQLNSVIYHRAEVSILQHIKEYQYNETVSYTISS